MKKVKYTSEEDFKEYEVEINDELYNIVEKINKHLSKTKKAQIIYNEKDQSIYIK